MQGGSAISLLPLLLILGSLTDPCLGHGRLHSPPGRSTAWRHNFKTEKNYEDNELFCGGFDRQWYRNRGRCGICGDPWDEAQPRENEDGGKYGKGIIVQTYRQGQRIEAVVEITAHHMGFFEFKLCPVTSPEQVPDQECLDRYPLELADGTGRQYYLGSDASKENYTIGLVLPPDLTCKKCVFQWHYHTGNRWGLCAESGRGSVGCGPQETFRACADVAIEPVDAAPLDPPSESAAKGPHPQVQDWEPPQEVPSEDRKEEARKPPPPCFFSETQPRRGPYPRK